jgi:fido (protein-threonine AMPylation protein)
VAFDPGYGETPLPFEELDALLPRTRDILDEPITKAAVYDLEQAIEASVAEELITEILEGRLTLETLLMPGFLRGLHEQLYGGIWQWAGQNRRHLLNIGVDPAYVAVELRTAIDTIRYRWEHTDDWSARELGIAAHAECVRVHPFVDGNGRSTRLYADLLFLAAQDSDDVELYDWSFDKNEYISLLREYDQHRDPAELAAFIPTYQP